MGLCGSANQAPTTNEDKVATVDSQQIDKALSKSNDQDQAIIKLLLLGAGESGKSTLFKQINRIYGKDFSDADKKAYRTVVSNNAIGCMKVLLAQTEKMQALGISGCQVAESAAASKQFVEELKGTEIVDDSIAQHIGTLWNDPGVRLTFENRAKFQLIDAAGYFFDRIEAIGKPDYSPNEQDILHSRVRTTGIVESSFRINNKNFKLFDVGGQRNERKKWIHCFENVTAVIFVAAISEYDQVLFEDQNTNRIDEALKLFDDICNSRWFTKTSIILFLNKRDLFAEKIKRTPLTICFPEYQGPNEYEACCQYFIDKFKTKNRSDSKQIYVNVTCATDTNNIQTVFNSVTDIIIRKSLEDGGLL